MRPRLPPADPPARRGPRRLCGLRQILNEQLCVLKFSNAHFAKRRKNYALLAGLRAAAGQSVWARRHGPLAFVLGRAKRSEAVSTFFDWGIRVRYCKAPCLALLIIPLTFVFVFLRWLLARAWPSPLCATPIPQPHRPTRYVGDVGVHSLPRGRDADRWQSA